MQVLVKTRQLHLLSDWVRSVIKQRKMTQLDFAKEVGMTRSQLTVKLSTGMTYNDVEKIAAKLDIPKPDLAVATLATLQEEIRSLSGTEEAKEFGMT